MSSAQLGEPVRERVESQDEEHEEYEDGAFYVTRLSSLEAEVKRAHAQPAGSVGQRQSVVQRIPVQLLLQHAHAAVPAPAPAPARGRAQTARMPIPMPMPLSTAKPSVFARTTWPLVIGAFVLGFAAGGAVFFSLSFGPKASAQQTTVTAGPLATR